MTRYETDNILVMLDWAPEDGVSYNVTTIPQIVIVFNTSTSVQLTLHYNTQYNVSILAALCGERNTAYYDLNFGESASQVLSLNE